MDKIIKNKLNQKLIYYLCLIGFFAIFSTTISKSPVLPLYVKALGGTTVIIGLISAFSPLAGILFSFPIGIISDRIGKKRLLIISGLIFIISPLLYLLVNSALYLIPIRFFHGCATAILGPVVSAMIIQKYNTAKGVNLGIYSSSTLVGRTLAPLFGGIIISYFANPALEIISYRLVYLFAFLLSIPSLILILLIKEEKVSKIKKLNKNIFLLDLKYFFVNKQLFSTSLVEMMIYFAYGVFETYLPLYLFNLNIPAYQIGLIFSVQIFSIAISKPLFGKLADRIDKRKQILFGVFLLGLAIGIIGFFQSIGIIISLGILFGLGLSFSTIATSTYVAEITKKNKLGASFGGLSSIMDIGQTFGPFLTGIIITYFSFKVGFIISLLLIILAAIIFYLNNKKINNEK